MGILFSAMSIISHPATGFPVGDPQIFPLSETALLSAADIAASASSLILSASGWRKVFAADGNEESNAPVLSAADTVIAGAAALAYGDFLKKRAGGTARGGGASPALLVGIDSRPTGPAIADAMIRVFLGMGLRPRYLFIVAAPEIMAYTAAAGHLEGEDRAEGFCYVSASHNPRGHNGLKFGLRDGGVIGAADSAELIASFRALLADPLIAEKVVSLMRSAEPKDVGRVFSSCSAWKRRSISAYTLLCREIIAGTDDPQTQEELFDDMAACAAKSPVGVVAELNGSARCLSIDRDFLEGLGLKTRFANDEPRAFAHRIVPEGESLADAMCELDAARRDDPAFCVGYVPDCDGDRGNLVVSTKDGGSRAVEAQEVFALSCVAELSCLVRSGQLAYDDAGAPKRKVAVVVNDATSMRVDLICQAFGVELRRAETGEANVVGLAAALREEGYLVRILGEGSNGGNITYPSRVRDPLATVGALLKLLLLKGQEGLFSIWLKKAQAAGISCNPGAAGGDYGVDEILASLPRFSTTSVFEERAALRVRSEDKAALKGRYATLFMAEWEGKKAELRQRFGIVSWKAFSTKGQIQEEIGSDFASSGKGGLKIVFSDASGNDRAFLWMRGSGTESVFRVMADVRDGSASDEEYLLDWHTSMVRKAD